MLADLYPKFARLHDRQTLSAYVAITLASAVAILSGCSASRPACPQSILLSPTLVYPIDGATNVPDGSFSVVLTWGMGPPDFLSNAALVSPGGTIGLQLGATPNPVPTPAATPLPPASSMLGAQVPALAAHTTYHLDVTINRPGPCGGVGQESIGSFTTQ